MMEQVRNVVDMILYTEKSLQQPINSKGWRQPVLGYEEVDLTALIQLPE